MDKTTKTHKCSGFDRKCNNQTIDNGNRYCQACLDAVNTHSTWAKNLKKPAPINTGGRPMSFSEAAKILEGQGFINGVHVSQQATWSWKGGVYTK